jgi:hypothetical protein
MAGGEICGSDSDCNDGNVCTQDDCDIIFPGVGICIHAPLTGNACPDDNNVCTLDRCSSGVCTHPPSSGNACTDDGNVCTLDRCANGGCTHPPSSGNACLDDGNDCTNDICGGGQCTHPNRTSGTVCDDSRECTANDVCDGAGTCEGTQIPDCGPSCPFGVSLQEDARRDGLLQTYRAYRDLVLGSSLEGRGYTALYYAHAEEVSAIMETSPALRRDVAVALLHLAPLVEEVANGGQVALTQPEQKSIEDLLASLQRQASVELSADLDALRAAMQKDAFWELLGVQVEDNRRSPR